MKLRYLAAAIFAMLVMALAGTAMADESDFVIENGVLVDYTGSDTKVVIPDGVTAIGDKAFYKEYYIKSVKIPSSVTSIGDYAFYDCTSLRSIKIPSSVTSIGEYAFASCDSLYSITIPSSVTSIGESAFGTQFDDCVSEVTIIIQKDANSFSLYSDVLNDLAYYTNVLIIIEDGATSIADSMFLNEDKIVSITIPSSVTSIGESAFWGCTSLSSITIPSSVTSIGEDAFKDCSYLSSITIPSSVTSIGDYAFQYCGSLSSITIPSSVTTIGEGAFYDCDSLSSVKLENSVIGSRMFYYCDSLSSITISSSVTSIGDFAFYCCDSLSSITIPSSVTSIGNSAFAGCDSLSSITIPSSVTTIGSSAFAGCDSLSSITIPSSVTSIGEAAFKSCDSLSKVVINGKVSLGGGAFAECPALKSVFTRGFSYVSTYGSTYPFDKDTVVFIAYDSAHGASIGGSVFDGGSMYTFRGSKSITPSDYTKARVYSAEASAKSTEKGGEVTITVIGNAAIDTLEERIPESAQLISESSETKGVLKIWQFTYKLNGAPGFYDFTYVNADKPSLPTATAQVLVSNGYQVISAEFDESEYKANTYAAATVYTDIGATGLKMYNGSTLVKTWDKSYAVEENGMLKWSVSHTFTGVGVRTLTFKATDGKNTCPGVKAKVTIVTDKEIDVTSAAFNSSYSAKGTAAAITVKTEKDAKYLAMYNGSSKIKTWDAATYSKLSGTTRVWSVKHTFTGAGDRTMTFKASYDNKIFGSAMTAKILITTGEQYDVESAAFEAEYYAKGKATTITVKSGLDAKYLSMFTESGSRAKTWDAATYSKVTGTERIWTVTHTFSGAGLRTMTFKGTADRKTYGAGKNAATLITTGDSIEVISARFNAAYVPKGTAASITVKTGADAKYLAIYNGTSKIKTWSASTYSKIEGTGRVWTVTYAFTGTGNKEMTFKASKDNKTFGTAKKASILVTTGSAINVKSAVFAKEIVTKGTAVAITVKTGADAQYLKMYTSTGSCAKTWKASGNSEISGAYRVWNVSHAFSGTGVRTMTFKGSKDNKTVGNGMTASITVTTGSEINTKSAAVSTKHIVKGNSVTFTVKTGADAKYLGMFVESGSRAKLLSAATYSKLDGGTRVWTYKHTFTGAGYRTLTFKGSVDGKNFGTGKSVSLLVSSGSDVAVTSASFAKDSVVKGNAISITVKTGADAQYLAMYAENSSRIKLWKASESSAISGNARVWTVKYTFSGAGTRTMTFKASKDNSTFGKAKTDTIMVTAE